MGVMKCAAQLEVGRGEIKAAGGGDDATLRSRISSRLSPCTVPPRLKSVVHLNERRHEQPTEGKRLTAITTLLLWLLLLFGM